MSRGVSDKITYKPYSQSEQWLLPLKKRSTECETVFGQIKANLKFRRFHLRGKEKVGIEWRLLMIGYDFKQIIRQLAG